MDNTRNRPPYIPKEWEVVNCMFCGEEKNNLHDKYGNNLQYTYVKCINCGLIYQSPRPKFNEDFLEAAYGKYFIFDPNYNYKNDPYNSFDKELMEILKFDTKKQSILDVGCAMGDFLHAAKRVYLQVWGVEISKEMAGFVTEKLNIDVINGYFEKMPENFKFSCVHMSHVIEHIPNPIEWLEKSKNLLTDNGVLVIAVPNMLSLTRRIKLFLKRTGLRKGKWKEAWRTPDHLFEPTIKSMKFVLEKTGYDIVSCYTYSRKDMISEKLIGLILNRFLMIGSNLRIYAIPKK